MISALSLRPDWFAPGWGFCLLPHYQWHDGRLQTLGGRSVSLSQAERAVAERCTGAQWRLAAEVSEGDEVMAALRHLVSRRVVLPLPPKAPPPVGGPIDLVLSPHVDDAALSLGVLIATSDRPVLVLNVFSRQAYQTGLRVPPDRLSAIARAEDRLAGNILGYRSLFTGLPGAQDRHGLRLGDVIGCDPGAPGTARRIERDGAEMLTHLRPRLKKIAEGNRIGRLFAPAGLGGHLDHLVVRQQALALADCLGAGPKHVGFYEDLPYAAFAPPGGPRRWILARASAPALARKQAALLAFATRLRSTDIAATMAFTASSGGEYSLTNPVESQAAWLASSP